MSIEECLAFVNVETLHKRSRFVVCVCQQHASKVSFVCLDDEIHIDNIDKTDMEHADSKQTPSAPTPAEIVAGPFFSIVYYWQMLLPLDWDITGLDQPG